MSAAPSSANEELETIRVLAEHALTPLARARVTTALQVIRAELIAKATNGAKANGHDKAPTEVHPLMLLWFATLNGIKHQHQLVKGLLLAGSLFVVYGESNSGKTFFLLDLALSIAAGLPWRGRHTRRGLVLYVAGEGASSVRARVAAWRVAHPEIAPGLPFAIVPQAVDFLSAPSIDQLIVTVRAAESECGESAVLIIVDTFARAIPGGNENDALDIGIAVAGADRIRTETGAALAFVHHSGKDPTKGARGSSALRAATDTEIQIEGLSGTRTATVTKQRDLESGQAMRFDLTSVQIGIDPDDQSAITSCVVVPVDAPAASTGRKTPSGKNQRLLLAALQEWKRQHPEMDVVSSIDLRAIAKSQGITKKSRLQEAVDPLRAIGWLQDCVGGFRFLSEDSV